MGKDEGSSKPTESSGEKMEASDEGRYAEDIPQAELSQSLHQAEVSFERSFSTGGRKGRVLIPDCATS
jgi:hypothetical protein